MISSLGALADSIAAALARRADLAGGPQADALITLVRAEHAAAGDVDPVSAVGRAFALGPLERELLLVAAAVEFDVRFCALFAALLGDPRRTRPTVGLALELCGHGSMSTPGRAALGVSAPLRRYSLVEIEGTEPVLLRPLRIADRVAAQLLGDTGVEPSVAALQVTIPSRRDATARTVARALSGGVALGHVRTREGAAGLASAHGAFALLNRAVMTIDLGRRRPSDDALALVRLAVREAGLLGLGLVLTGVDELLPSDAGLLGVLTTAQTQVVVVDDVAWNPEWVQQPMITVEATDLDHAERVDAWRRTLQHAQLGPLDDAGLRELAALRATPEGIAAAVRTAAVTRRSERALTVDELRLSARALTSGRLSDVANRVVPRARLADVIAPPATLRELQDVVTWARVRDQLLARSGLTGKGSKGRGVTAMFAGPPGTGKTLAAEAVAGELGIDLYTVDLSMVIDKYIGETQKKLEQAFSEAQNLDVVLFFDEADALFGARSTVSDARDRYANQEVAYLLQRIEKFEGLALLATNFGSNLDAAFSRRLHHVIQFPHPDAPTRRRLWQAHLDEVLLDAADPVDLDWLSTSIDLAGGSIRNIVMAAAFAAASRERPYRPLPVGMRHVLGSIAREYVKLGRRTPSLPDLPTG